MAIKTKIAKVLIRPPVRPSNGAQTLRNALGPLAKLARFANPTDVLPLQYKMIVNWGNSTALPAARHKFKVLNAPTRMAFAINKKLFFQTAKEKGVRIPEFSTREPVLGEGVWFARTNLSGSCGNGIVALRKGDSIPKAELYVRYVPKTVEYRVHVVAGKVIFAQQKKRKNGVEQDRDQKLIRNHANGWVFCPVGIEYLSQDVRDVAISTVAALGLDFGAVDLIVGKSDDLAYALEVNTAPGLESEGLINAYAHAFSELAEAA